MRSKSLGTSRSSDVKAKYRVALLLPSLLTASGCAGVLVAGSPPHGHAYEVPPGHLPPPGQCRIWYPGVPPGQQPPPGDCYELSRHVPPDAYLVYGK
jgi:hypothetical protein